MKTTTNYKRDALLRHIFKATAMTLLLFLPCMAVSAQTRFDMEEDHGHYFINTTVNGHAGTRLFVESGVPGLMVSEDYYKTAFADARLKKAESKFTKIRAFESMHDIKQVLKGRVTIGGLCYTGKIYVIDKFDNIAVPVHRLRNEEDTTAYMPRFNFKQKTLDFVGINDIDTAKMHRYKLLKYRAMPAIEATLGIIDHRGNNGTVTGPFIFDLGNASALFLLKDHPKTSEFLKQGGFKLNPAKDSKSGRKVTDGILAKVCHIGSRIEQNVSIAVTDKIKMRGIVGIVGPKMFSDGYVVIDAKNKLIYYE